MARKETLVQLTDDLVYKLDTLAREREVSRSELIRNVLSEFVRREDYQEKVRRDIEGYTKFPPDLPDDWGSLEDWHTAAQKAREDEELRPW